MPLRGTSLFVATMAEIFEVENQGRFFTKEQKLRVLKKRSLCFLENKVKHLSCLLYRGGWRFYIVSQGRNSHCGSIVKQFCSHSNFIKYNLEQMGELNNFRC